MQFRLSIMRYLRELEVIAKSVACSKTNCINLHIVSGQLLQWNLKVDSLSER